MASSGNRGTFVPYGPRTAKERDMCKGNGKRSIAVSNQPHRYGNSRAICDHAVLPATRHT